MIEHLLYVLWHDHWKPWLKNKLEWAGYIALAAAITSVIFCGLIWLTLEIDRVVQGFYGG